MDVDSLRKELEEHLKNNPDDHAPNGFRDRFEETAEDLAAADSDESRAELEAQLRQIRVEAEMAVKCACDDGGEAPAPMASRKEVIADAPVTEAKADDSGTAAGAGSADPEIVEAKIDDHGAARRIDDPEPRQGLMQRYGLLLVVILIVVAAAAYYFRG
jgi:hypothetical protein